MATDIDYKLIYIEAPSPDLASYPTYAEVSKELDNKPETLKYWKEQKWSPNIETLRVGEFTKVSGFIKSGDE